MVKINADTNDCLCVDGANVICTTAVLGALPVQIRTTRAIGV